MQSSCDSSSPALDVSDSCLIDRDLSNHVLGKVKEFSSIPNLHTILKDEGFSDVNVSYIGVLTLQEACDVFVSDERLVWVDYRGCPIKRGLVMKLLLGLARFGERTLDLEEKCGFSFVSKWLCQNVLSKCGSVLVVWRISFVFGQGFGISMEGLREDLKTSWEGRNKERI
ncbi:hypothetical protein Tco_0935035 [Tanacetum coccineum]